MPIKLADLAKQVSTITVRFAGLEDVLSVRYSPHRMTPLKEMAFLDAVRSDEATRATVELLADVVVGWDLLDDDGRPLPTDYATLSGMPSALLMAVMHALGQERNANPTKPAS